MAREQFKLRLPGIFRRDTHLREDFRRLIRRSKKAVCTIADDEEAVEGGTDPSREGADPFVLPAFPHEFVTHYLTTEASVNDALRPIVDGVVGFDSEFVPRRYTLEEGIINETMDMVVELKTNRTFPIAWEKIGLCVIQIARGPDVWVIHMSRVKVLALKFQTLAFPAELKRVLTSPHIRKVGVGLVSDVQVIWNDLRTDMTSLVDVGLMARLLLAEKYSAGGYQNLSAEVTTAEILGYRLDKTQQVSDWTQKLTPDQAQYAAADAAVSLQLYNTLVARLASHGERLGRHIPEGWYTFNSRLGDLTRTKRSIRNEVVPWSPKDCTWFFGGKFQGYFPY
ncbi:ribonuclease H-like domain-containing protein [Mycena metata]|uniref:Ribonuclease H-like domain-containing protein n=1 Tax=Mycena metata TaxID=1033252 RepID=A0AAD7IX66_9AGAR|nr:ribonuclease H-like domain-containing protein [Mycena metata]